MLLKQRTCEEGYGQPPAMETHGFMHEERIVPPGIVVYKPLLKGTVAVLTTETTIPKNFRHKDFQWFLLAGLIP